MKFWLPTVLALLVWAPATAEAASEEAVGDEEERKRWQTSD